MGLLKKLCPDFSEASTYKGIITLLGLFGVRIAPELTPYIIMFGVLVYGLLHIFLPDRFKNAPDLAEMEEVLNQLPVMQPSTTPPPVPPIPELTGQTQEQIAENDIKPGPPTSAGFGPQGS